MANYTTNVSDKSKAKAKKMTLCGGIGLQYFYVGRIKAGIIRLFVGFIFWMAIITGIATKEVPMIIMGILLLVAVTLFEFIKISMGKFKDDMGNYIRQD